MPTDNWKYINISDTAKLENKSSHIKDLCKGSHVYMQSYSNLNEKYIKSLLKVRIENYGKGAISNINNSHVYIFRTERNPCFIFAISAR